MSSTRRPGYSAFLDNPTVDRSGPYPDDLREILDPGHLPGVMDEVRGWSVYRPTPLRRLPGLARRLGVGELLYKDEASRFGLGSFKAVGAVHGLVEVVRRALAAAGGAAPGVADLRRGRAPEAVRQVTVCCATDGNHGRAVAWAARQIGCSAVVYLPAAVSDQRERAIAGEGARVRRVDGSYDDAVRRADQDARRHGWHVVSDHAYPGYETVPRDIMVGYGVIMAEVEEQLAAGAGPGPPPDVIFVPAGVGGLAASVCAYGWDRWGTDRPVLVVVEPEAADAVRRSVAAGRLVTAPGSLRTAMGCLSCGEVSTAAWPVLQAGADAFVSIPDERAVEAVRCLAHPEAGDPVVEAGESGAAALGGLLALAATRGTAGGETGRAGAGGRDADPGDTGGALELGPRTRVLVLGTEGVNEPGRWARIVGRPPRGAPG